MFNLFKKRQDKKSDFELEDDDDDQPDSSLIEGLRLHLSRMIVYAESADVKLQREVSILQTSLFYYLFFTSVACLLSLSAAVLLSLSVCLCVLLLNYSFS